MKEMFKNSHVPEKIVWAFFNRKDHGDFKDKNVLLT